MYKARGIDEAETETVVDLRSDTMTRPSPAMLQKMISAKLGDDVVQEDPTVSELERRIAKILGKEAGLFVTSGTMGNFLAGLVHCNVRGSEVIVGDKNHTFLYEQGNLAQFGGIQCNIIPVETDGTFSLAGVRNRIRDHSDDHYPKTALISVENTQNYYGGVVLPLEWIDEVTKLGKEYGIPLHMDGARLFNASVASGISPQRIVQGFSSVSICLSKGLGAPIGSLLVGDQVFIRQARRLRKALGGGMRQVGVLAAAGLFCLDNMVNRLADDHRHARACATAVHSLQSPAFTADLKAAQSNMVLLVVDQSIPAGQVCERLEAITEEEKSQLGDSIKILAWPRTENRIRLVFHCDVTEEMAKIATEKICLVAQEFASKMQQ